MSDRSQKEIRVLVADDEVILAERLVEFLSSSGFYTRYVRSGTEAKKVIADWRPDFILCDLMLPDMNALAFLKYLKENDWLGDDKIRFFVLSGHNIPKNVTECMRLGASDYLVKPIKHTDLLTRLVLHGQAKHQLPQVKPEAAPDNDNALYYLHLTDLTLREALKNVPITETLHNLTGMVSLAMKAVRVSLVRCNFDERKGHVLASSDKRGIGGLELDLNKYPEILYVLRNDCMLALDNLAADPAMAFVARLNKSIHFNSLIVCPVRMDGERWGVLSVRLPASKTTLTDSEIRYAQLVAHVAGLVLRADPAARSNQPPIPRSA